MSIATLIPVIIMRERLLTREGASLSESDRDPSTWLQPDAEQSAEMGAEIVAEAFMQVVDPHVAHDLLEIKDGRRCAIAKLSTGSGSHLECALGQFLVVDDAAATLVYEVLLTGSDLASGDMEGLALVPALAPDQVLVVVRDDLSEIRDPGAIEVLTRRGGSDGES